MSKKSAIATIIIFVLIIAGLIYWLHLAGLKTAQAPIFPAQNISGTASSTPRAAVPITAVDPSKLPDRFPSDIPLEAGATVTYNYNAINSAGLFQSSRTFISQKTLGQNFSLYQTSLKKSGWTITQAINDSAGNRYIILATKGGNNLNILISNNTSGQVTVSINNETKP